MCPGQLRKHVPKQVRKRELTLGIRVIGELLEELDDGRAGVELVMGKAFPVGGDADGERASVQDHGVEEREVVLD